MKCKLSKSPWALYGHQMSATHFSVSELGVSTTPQMVKSRLLT